MTYRRKCRIIPEYILKFGLERDEVMEDWWSLNDENLLDFQC
jgi:hypothetical protein